MILAIDIGNTNIVIGCFDKEKIIFTERVSTNHTATAIEYAISIKNILELHAIESSRINGGIISSVVPSVTATVKEAFTKIVGKNCMVVGPGIKTGLRIIIDNPAELGADLVVDAVGGLAEYEPPLIIIDMGTATTFSVIDRNKNYTGGLILPGVRVSLDSLVSGTSQLPKIGLEAPEKIIGKNTVDCMKSGIIYSAASGIDGLCERIEEELGEKATMIATGGLASTIIPFCRKKIIVDDELLLKGLRVIYRKNV